MENTKETAPNVHDTINEIIELLNNEQEKALVASVELWNLFMEIPESDKHPDDTNDFRFHIHALQNILRSQLYEKMKYKTLKNTNPS